MKGIASHCKLLHLHRMIGDLILFVISGTCSSEWLEPKENGEKQLSRDTAIAIHHTCYGIIELVQNLLVEESYEYVCLAEFSTDTLEKAFGKLCQGSGGAFFVTTQQITEKLRINQARLQITFGSDNIPDLEGWVDDVAKTNLVHIAGYVVRKLNIADSGKDTFSYYEKYGDYTALLDHGGLRIPEDSVCQWTFFSYIMFQLVKTKVCRTSLTTIFLQISDAYNFKLQESCCRILVNLFINKFCKESTPLLRKEAKQKNHQAFVK